MPISKTHRHLKKQTAHWLYLAARLVTAYRLWRYMQGQITSLALYAAQKCILYHWVGDILPNAVDKAGWSISLDVFASTACPQVPHWYSSRYIGRPPQLRCFLPQVRIPSTLSTFFLKKIEVPIGIKINSVAS